MIDLTTLPSAEELGDDEFSFLEFANDVLGFDETFHDTKTGRRGVYTWQEDALTPFDEASEHLVQVTVVTPNGSGKSAVIIPTLVLGWLAMYPEGRVVLTTADGKQLDGQVMPAIESHRAKFPEWKFIEREVHNNTGGWFKAWTTDQPGRAEGWHKLNDEDGPLLIIVDEGKTVEDSIYEAIDRCTYNAILYTSSPGAMHGRFYDSQSMEDNGFVKVKAGLLDCPHIPQEKIDRLYAQHGPQAAKPNPQLLRSTLHGEFMLAEGELKFDQEGLDHLMEMAKEGHAKGRLGVLIRSRAFGSVQFFPDPNGWLWMGEPPGEGDEVLMFCDPNAMEQGAGTSERDNTACGILRKGGMTREGEERKDTLVAALHWPGGVKWDSDITAGRMKLLSEVYGNCQAVVEANNFGSALMKDCQKEGLQLWQRTKVDDVNPNKQVKLLGFLSTGRSREHWVQACAAAIREKALIIRYQPAASEFGTFIIDESGKAQAQAGCHDDWVAGIGIGLVVRCFSVIPYTRGRLGAGSFSYQPKPLPNAINQFGACG